MSESFEVGNVVASARAGTKVHGSLVIENDDAATVKLLVGVIKGSEKGPVICITGGMYGTHYPGIDACIQLYNEMDPERLKGVIITVPVVEMTGFQKCMDVSPIDGLNPNGYYFMQGPLFPGDPEGTVSHRVAHTIFNEVIRKSDYHLDLRGGDLWETLNTFSISNETGNKDFDDETEAMAKALGTKYYLTAPYNKGSLISEACKAGIRSVILEASKGLASYDEEDVQSCLMGIRRLLEHLKMIEGKPDSHSEPRKLEFKMHFIFARYGGLLYLRCKHGEVTSEGQKLGEIRNLKGETLQELFAPIAGIIHCTFPKHIKNPGELILGMRRILG